jgi:hypothetical protein
MRAAIATVILVRTMHGAEYRMLSSGSSAAGWRHGGDSVMDRTSPVVRQVVRQALAVDARC